MENFDSSAIGTALAERWSDELRPGERFEARVEVETGKVHAQIALVAPDDAERHEFDVETPLTSQGAEWTCAQALDAADAILGEWFEDERPRLVDRTEERVYEGLPMRVSSRRVAPRLQAEADRLLGDGDEFKLDS